MFLTSALNAAGLLPSGAACCFRKIKPGILAVTDVGKSPCATSSKVKIVRRSPAYYCRTVRRNTWNKYDTSQIYIFSANNYVYYKLVKVHPICTSEKKLLVIIQNGRHQLPNTYKYGCINDRIILFSKSGFLHTRNATGHILHQVCD